MHLIPESERRKKYEKEVYESGRASFEIGFWTFDSNKSSRVDETKMTQPMLIISGLEDRITPNAVHQKIAKKYQHIAELKEYENHAHSIIHEPGWETIADDIFEWLHK
jgi:alpha-beta hydrolase superfamily lysophospholipase